MYSFANKKELEEFMVEAFQARPQDIAVMAYQMFEKLQAWKAYAQDLEHYGEYELGNACRGGLDNLETWHKLFELGEVKAGGDKSNKEYPKLR